MEITLHTLSYDVENNGTGCEVLTAEIDLHRRQKEIMESYLTGEDGAKAEHVRQLIADDQIAAAWDIWYDADNGLRDPLNTHHIDESPLQLSGLAFELAPTGTGKVGLPACFTDCGIELTGHAKGAGAWLDWYNDALQIVIDGAYEEPAVHVRYNADGSIAEILVHEDLTSKVTSTADNCSDWQKARDGKI